MKAMNTARNNEIHGYLPPLSDEIALLILARVPRSHHPLLSSLNRRYRSLIRSGGLYTIRRELAIRQPSVLILATGDPLWRLYDPVSAARRVLPLLPSDSCFSAFDKESFSAGTHLLVSGKEISGSVIWRYELSPDRWFRGPPMITSRSLFASASCVDAAFVAGGVSPAGETLNTAEKYNSLDTSWSPLPRMNRRRKLCSGCCMDDNKFLVVGGQDERGSDLTCGESYDPVIKKWELITGVIGDGASPSCKSRSPPLVAVANGELYALEATTNRVRVYVKRSHAWKDMGEAPVRADRSRGWGVAFKSLGDELLVIGTTSESYSCRGMTICTCRPEPGAETLRWRVLEGHGEKWSSFIFNCSVMMA